MATVRASVFAPAACALAAAAGVLAGCAGGRGAAPASRPGAAGSAAASAGLVPTHARALAFARAVNLRLGDVPEAKPAPDKGSSGAEEGSTLERCAPPWGRAHKVAEVESKSFKRGSELETEWIGSDVLVVPSATASVRELLALTGSGARRCLGRALTRLFAAVRVKNGRFGQVQAYRLPISAPGADAAIRLRFATTLIVPAAEVTVPLYIDLLAFDRGPAKVAVFDVSGTQPAPESSERELLALLLARARTHAI